MIRTALFGFGISGRVFHAPLVHADEQYSLAAIVTAEPGRVAAARTLYPDARIIPTSDELFAQVDAGDLDLDLAVIGTPPATHKRLALAALGRGLHVVVDKPFVPSSAEAEELITAAADAGRVLTVFQNRRWDGDFLTLQQLLRDGKLGEVRTFESRFEWWMPDGFRNWRDEAFLAEGGGILHDLGAHLIDQAVQLFGPVVEVHGETRRYGDPSRSDADEDAFVSLLHGSGTRSRLWMNGQAPRPGPRFHVVGSHAAYTKWGLDGQEQALAAGVVPGDPKYGMEPQESWGIVGAGVSSTLVPTMPGAYPQFYSQLAQTVLAGAPLLVDPHDALEVLRIIERARSK